MWKKLLYIKQNFPDNYTDKSFLSQLRRNATVQKYSYWRLIIDFSLFSFHFSCLAVVHLVFYALYTNHYDPVLLLATTGSITAVLYLFYRRHNTHKRNTFIKSSILITCCILTLSPVLKSLSESTSSDSVWSLSVWLCVLNITSTDYHFDLNKKYNPIFATNILIADSIVLASRLNSTNKVFTFILFAFAIYGILPTFDTWLRKNYINLHWALIVLLQLIVITSVYRINTLILISWLVVNFAIVFVNPLYFLMMQKYKDELQGPWDIAEPIIK